MILLDRGDVIRLDLWAYPFLIEWEVGSSEAVEADYADIIAEGPFVLVVHDEDAWAGQGDSLYRVAQKRADPINHRQWKDLADLYAASMGITRQSLVLRYSAMTRRLRRRPLGLGWARWDHIYHWPEGDDLAWSALMYGHHPHIEAREHEGQRQVRYAG
jgi:hypothetical protein